VALLGLEVHLTEWPSLELAVCSRAATLMLNRYSPISALLARRASLFRARAAAAAALAAAATAATATATTTAAAATAAAIASGDAAAIAAAATLAAATRAAADAAAAAAAAGASVGGATAARVAEEAAGPRLLWWMREDGDITPTHFPFF